MHELCMVFGKNVDEQLRPFHQYECTNRYDEYVRDIDVTEETRRDWLKYGERKMVRLADGSEYSATDSRFIAPVKKSSAKNAKWAFLRDRRYQYPEGSTQFVKKLTFQEYAGEDETNVFQMRDGKIEFPPGCDPKEPRQTGQAAYAGPGNIYDYSVKNEAGEIIQLFRRTNPNARWDWYVEGGRWRDFLPLKMELSTAGRIGMLYRPELMTRKYATTARLRDIDWGYLEDSVTAQAEVMWSVVNPLVKDCRWTPFAEMVRGLTPYGKEYFTAAKEYGKQRGLKRMRRMFPSLWWPDDYILEKEVFIKLFVMRGVTPACYIEDGIWHSRDHHEESAGGNEMSWSEKFMAYLNTLDPDTLLTVVDIHI